MARMTDEEVDAWEETRDIGQEILEGVRELQAGRRGRTFTAQSYPLLRVREKSGLTRAEFAALLGVSRRTVERWEQGRRKPGMAAMMLIRVAERHPEVLRQMMVRPPVTHWGPR